MKFSQTRDAQHLPGEGGRTRIVASNSVMNVVTFRSIELLAWFAKHGLPVGAPPSFDILHADVQEDHWTVSWPAAFNAYDKIVFTHEEWADRVQVHRCYVNRLMTCSATIDDILSVDGWKSPGEIDRKIIKNILENRALRKEALNELKRSAKLVEKTTSDLEEGPHPSAGPKPTLDFASKRRICEKERTRICVNHLPYWRRNQTKEHYATCTHPECWAKPEADDDD